MATKQLARESARRRKHRLRKLQQAKKAKKHAKRRAAVAGMESPRQALASAFLTRSLQVLQDLTAKAPADVLKAALGDPDPVGGVAALLSSLAASGSRIEADPLLEAIARGAGLKSELLKQAGGTWSAQQVADALGVSRQAVDKRRARGALLAVPSGTGDYLYPRCQFTADGIVPHVDRVLGAFRVENPWTRLSGLLTPAATLGGKSALDALRAGDVDGAVAAVASIGDTLDEDSPPLA